MLDVSLELLETSDWYLLHSSELLVRNCSPDLASQLLSATRLLDQATALLGSSLQEQSTRDRRCRVRTGTPGGSTSTQVSRDSRERPINAKTYTISSSRGDVTTISSTAEKFLHGETLDTLLSLKTSMEFVPELPAPKSKRPHANPFGAFSASARTGDPTDPNYFSDAESERTQSVAEEYKEAELAEQAAAGITDNPSAKQPVAQKDIQRSSSNRDSLQKAERSIEGEMAGRGRGRPLGSGMLKGATWEHDASIKLESKPTDLFPVGSPMSLINSNSYHL